MVKRQQPAWNQDASIVEGLVISSDPMGNDDDNDAAFPALPLPPPPAPVVFPSSPAPVIPHFPDLVYGNMAAFLTKEEVLIATETCGQFLHGFGSTIPSLALCFPKHSDSSILFSLLSHRSRLLKLSIKSSEQEGNESPSTSSFRRGGSCPCPSSQTFREFIEAMIKAIQGGEEGMATTTVS